MAEPTAADGRTMDPQEPGGQAAERQVAAVRAFNRVYARQLGQLERALPGRDFSLTEVRVLSELAERGEAQARELRRDLGLDSGYLSRILKSFERRGLAARRRSEADARQALFRLTPAGTAALQPLVQAADAQVAALLARLTPDGRRELVAAMATIRRLLAAETAPPAVPYLLREPQPGDLGWVVHRHGALYRQEYGWDGPERLAAEIAAGFLEYHDPTCERGWIAERDGGIAGSVVLMCDTPEIARLRLLYVEPAARGLGIGTRLVAEGVRFARQAGYLRIALRTVDPLQSARRIFEAAGFELVDERPHHDFGRELTGQEWALEL